jgi:hypothetical protein
MTRAGSDEEYSLRPALKVVASCYGLASGRATLLG